MSCMSTLTRGEVTRERTKNGPKCRPFVVWLPPEDVLPQMAETRYAEIRGDFELPSGCSGSSNGDNYGGTRTVCKAVGTIFATSAGSAVARYVHRNLGDDSLGANIVLSGLRNSVADRNIGFFAIDVDGLIGRTDERGRRLDPKERERFTYYALQATLAAYEGVSVCDQHAENANRLLRNLGRYREF